ncbi:hypothetical protein I79_004006 [Cricetulus griseus]|uniref:Uncharacterized protein n=1 Tax=Cricetulus griseus TaxID=10029 RepID=G3H1I0_CRIGR|nr:hypothetical protein I79_004006 [Cricetulus griseus]
MSQAQSMGQGGSMIQILLYQVESGGSGLVTDRGKHLDYNSGRYRENEAGRGGRWRQN